MINQKTEEISGLILQQETCAWASLSWGEKGTIARNGCGLVSIYNLFCLLKVEDSDYFDCFFKKLYREFLFKKFCLMLSPLCKGKMGTNPFVLFAFLKKSFPTARMYLFPFLSFAPRYGCIFLYVGYQKGWFGHYVACTYTENGPFLPNDRDAHPVSLEQWRKGLRKNHCFCIAAFTI